MYCHECLCVLLIDGLNFGSLLARIDTVNRHSYPLLYLYLVNLCGVKLFLQHLQKDEKG